MSENPTLDPPDNDSTQGPSYNGSTNSGSTNGASTSAPPPPLTGGRRHKGSKKMHKGKRHGNASLRAWVTFVKKVQKEEGIGYKEAMSAAKKRKDSGEKWRGGDGDERRDMPDYSNSMGMEGGRRRRRSKKHRGSKKCGGSKKRRHSRRH